MKNLLIVVDMVNGFINEGALADMRINTIIPSIVRKLERAKENGDMIIAFKDTHEENDEEFKLFPPHCVIGSNECELVKELKPYENQMLVINKNTTNGFNTNMMKTILENNRFDNIEITGCCTDICVSALTQSLVKYFAENKIDTKIHISENSVDTFNAPNHDADKINAQTLKELEEIGVSIAYNNAIKPISVKKLTDRKFLNMFEVTYEGENGLIKYEMVTRRKLPEIVQPTLKPDAVHMIPYSYVQGSMVVYLIKEFKRAIGDFVYGLPAGLVDEGEDSMTSAIRELDEEIGAKVKHIKLAESATYSSLGMTDEKAELYEAEVTLTGQQHLTGNENIEVVPVKIGELENLLDNEKFGVRSKYGLRNFLYKQKIKKLEKKIQEYEDKEIENFLYNEEQER